MRPHFTSLPGRVFFETPFIPPHIFTTDASGGGELLRRAWSFTDIPFFVSSIPFSPVESCASAYIDREDGFIQHFNRRHKIFFLQRVYLNLIIIIFFLIKNCQIGLVWEGQGERSMKIMTFCPSLGAIFIIIYILLSIQHFKLINKYLSWGFFLKKEKIYGDGHHQTTNSI